MLSLEKWKYRFFLDIEGRPLRYRDEFLSLVTADVTAERHVSAS